jgi:hypothetical protein
VKDFILSRIGLLKPIAVEAKTPFGDESANTEELRRISEILEEKVNNIQHLHISAWLG